MSDIDFDVEIESKKEFSAEEITDLVYQKLMRVRILRDEKDELNDRLKVINKELDDLDKVLVNLFDARHTENMRVTGVGTAYLHTTIIPQILDGEKMLEWLDQHGEGRIAPRTIHHQTLRSWMRDRMERGDELPEETLLTSYQKRQVRIRR